MNHERPFLIEVCANSLESAAVAQEGGADRIELCDNIAEGGTTPSYGVLARTRELLHIGLCVLIRPCGGDFLYSDDEFDSILYDVEMCKRIGADGVVIGMLQADGNIDTSRCRHIVDAAGMMPTIFHRAFDMTPDPLRALNDVQALGCTRILTSGHAPTAWEGRDVLADLVRRAGDTLGILPGGGVNETNVAELVRHTGVQEVHVSLREQIPSGMLFQKTSISMGGTSSVPASDFVHSVSSSERIRAVRALAEKRV
jgi:copper homeostasis protein